MMMAAGGLIAAVGFAMGAGSDRIDLELPALGRRSLPVYGLAAVSGLGLGLAFLTLVLPPVFRRLAGLVSSPIPGVGPEALPRLDGRLLMVGLLWFTAGWLLLGLSQVAVVRAFDPEGARALAAPGRCSWWLPAWRWRRSPDSWWPSCPAAWACARGC